MGLDIDKSRWPIVVFTFRASKDSKQVIDAYLNAYEKLLSRGEPFLSVTQIVDFHAKDIAHAAAVGKWVKANTRLLQNYCMGVAVVKSSELVRYALSSFDLISPMPVPHCFAEDLPEALEWAEVRVEGKKTMSEFGGEVAGGP